MTVGCCWCRALHISYDDNHATTTQPSHNEQAPSQARRANLLLLPIRSFCACNSGMEFPTRRMEWSQLVEIIAVDKDLARLRRSQQDQQVYDEYMTNVVRAHYHTVMDFILITKLNVPVEDEPTAEGIKKRVVPIQQVTNNGTQVRKRLVPNDFPYYFERDVEHWILWKLGGDGIAPTEIEEAKDELRQKLGNVADTLHWINPPALKSIPEIDHVHILCRRPSKDKCHCEPMAT